MLSRLKYHKMSIFSYFYHIFYQAPAHGTQEIQGQALGTQATLVPAHGTQAHGILEILVIQAVIMDFL